MSYPAEANDYPIPPKHLERFRLCWGLLADDHQVDALGSASYRRTLSAWRLLGYPVPCSGFILALASVGPGGPG